MENRQTHSTDDSRVKVLVVDDHPNTANMLARAISRLGSHVEVVSATSGVEALQHVEDGAAAILITDMMMPEMTGMEWIETLNDTPSLTPAVTFLLTAHDSAGVREIARRLNVKEVISKPAHPEQICELISQTVDELKKSQPVETESTPQAPVTANPRTAPKQEDLNISELIWEVAKKFQPQADIKNHPLFQDEHVYFTEEAATYLVQAGIKLVGIDYLSFEKPGSREFPAHHALLQAGVVIVEGLDLSEAEPGEYDLVCLPLRVVGADGAPALVLLKSRA